MATPLVVPSDGSITDFHLANLFNHFSFIKPFLCTVENNLVSLSDFWHVEGINAELRLLSVRCTCE